jgi:hypothetical protein
MEALSHLCRKISQSFFIARAVFVLLNVLPLLRMQGLAMHHMLLVV